MSLYKFNNLNEDNEDKEDKENEHTRKTVTGNLLNHINPRIRFCYIYRLSDPLSGYFYIGSTTNVERRYFGHMDSIENGRKLQKCHKKFIELGVKPQMQILDRGMWTESERYIKENQAMDGKLGDEKCLNRMIAGKKWHWCVAAGEEDRKGRIYNKKLNKIYEPMGMLKGEISLENAKFSKDALASICDLFGIVHNDVTEKNELEEIPEFDKLKEVEQWKVCEELESRIETITNKKAETNESNRINWAKLVFGCASIIVVVLLLFFLYKKIIQANKV